MRAHQVRIGMRIGRLTVRATKLAASKHHRKRVWICECDCGVVKEVQTGNLGRNTNSCGCWREELRPMYQRKHGRARSVENRIWAHMRARCENQSDKAFVRYGAVGIRVCDRWKGKNGFSNFFEDMGQRPSDRHEIDRRDSLGNYDPLNCRWLLKKYQPRNYRSNLLLTFRGVTLCAAEWASVVGIDVSCIYFRNRRKWSVERVLTEPTNNNGVKNERKKVVIMAEEANGLDARSLIQLSLVVLDQELGSEKSALIRAKLLEAYIDLRKIETAEEDEARQHYHREHAA